MAIGGDNMMDYRRGLMGVSILAIFGCLLVACGTGTGDGASPSSLPFVDTTTSVAEATSTIESAAPAESTAPVDSAPQAAPPQLTAEMFEGMLETESGRALLIGSIAAEANLETEQASCLIDAVPIDILVEAAGAYLGGSGQEGFFDAAQMQEIDPILDSCGVSADALLR